MGVIGRLGVVVALSLCTVGGVFGYGMWYGLQMVKGACCGGDLGLEGPSRIVYSFSEKKKCVIIYSIVLLK